ncbi:MAG: FlgD immunoglobulin-like domain containing protein [Pseudomonadota bacterium]
MDKKTDEENKLNESADSKGFSFKDCTKKSAAVGMSGIVGKTGESQMKFTQDILLKQLECQTPDNSFDPTQMAQMMMSMVTVAQNNEMVDIQRQNMELQRDFACLSANSFKGEMVEHSGNEFDYRDQDQEIVFNLPAKTGAAILNIFDAQKQRIKTVELDNKIGRSSFVWDGKTNSGENLPKGIYTAFVTAEDDQGNPIDIPIRLKSNITDIVYNENNMPVLLSGSIAINDILRRTINDKATQRYQEVAMQTAPAMAAQASQLKAFDGVFDGSHI